MSVTGDFLPAEEDFLVLKSLVKSLSVQSALRCAKGDFSDV